LKFVRSSFTGLTIDLTSGALESEFQIIANNSGFAPYVEGCLPVSTWNGYICQGSTKLGMLLFDSEDADTEDRSV
jgi:hypothetical protein